MKQRKFIFDQAQNGKNPKEIENLLKEQFGKEAFHKTTIYKWFNYSKLGFDLENERERPGPKPDEQLCTRIQQIIEEEPFSSLRSIADELNEENSTIYRYLTKYLNREYRSSKWIPHSLNDALKANRIETLKELLKILNLSKHESFKNLVTGDQKWFTLYYANDGAWIESDQNPPQMIDDQISIKKVMVTIIWGVYGFYIVDFLPPNTSYDSTYFVNNILIPLSEKREQIWSGSKKKKMWIHLDNSRIHNSKLTSSNYDSLGFKRPPHPAYSPDVAPSDFYLFGFLEEKLKGRKFKDPDELFESIIEILDSISMETLKSVFNHWIERCNWVINNGGEYFIK